MSFTPTIAETCETAVVKQWGKNKFLELPETFARFRRVEIAPHAGVPDLSQAISLRNTFQHVKDFQGT